MASLAHRAIVFGEIPQTFVARSPTTVTARRLLERLLYPEALDHCLEATAPPQVSRCGAGAGAD